VDVVDARAWVEIRLGAKTMTLHVIGRKRQTWGLLAVGDNGSRWPTPTGTFWVQRVGVSVDPRTVYGSGAFVELSARSSWAEADIVAIHAWRAPIKPGESSHGCLRAPDAAVAAAAAIPLGSPVVIVP
jgi:lipoprotein-anchoring transpeptidase ErfK/SrfK